MAYRKRFGKRTRFGRKSTRSLSRGRRANRIARRTFRKVLRLPKRVVAKKYANTAGQIAFRSRRSRPSHKRFGSRRKFGQRRFNRNRGKVGFV